MGGRNAQYIVNGKSSVWCLQWVWRFLASAALYWNEAMILIEVSIGWIEEDAYKVVVKVKGVPPSLWDSYWNLFGIAIVPPSLIILISKLVKLTDEVIVILTFVSMTLLFSLK